MSTFSTSLQLQLIGNGEQTGTWGTTTNTNWNLIEQAVAGVTSITMLNADYTLTVVNGASDEARNMVLVVGGTNSAIRKVIAPLVTKVYVVYNNTSGGYAITVGGSTGATVTVPNGASTLVYCDGTNFYGGLTGTTGNWNVPGTVTATTFSGAGTGLTGTASSLTVGNAANAANATSATTATAANSATNLFGGTTGSLPYQTSNGVTSFLSQGTSGQVLTSAGTGAAPTWTTVSGGGGGTVTSVGGTGNGLGFSLGGTVTTTGNLTLSVPSASALATSINAGVLNGSNTWTSTNSWSASSTFTGGVYIVGSDPSSGNWKFYVKNSGTNPAAVFYSDNNSAVPVSVISGHTGDMQTFFYGSPGSVSTVGGISTNGTNVSYNTSSDRRLKRNIIDYSNSGAVIDALKPRMFTWSANNTQDVGFIADELEEVIPQAVTGKANAIGANGQPVYQMIDCSTPEMMANIIAELQSLRKRVAELEAK